jgi:hypothetical protein
LIGLRYSLLRKFLKKSGIFSACAFTKAVNLFHVKR